MVNVTTGLVRRTLVLLVSPHLASPRLTLPRRLRVRVRVCDVARCVISTCNVCTATRRDGTAANAYTDSRIGAAPWHGAIDLDGDPKANTSHVGRTAHRTACAPQVLTLNRAIRKGRAFGHNRPRREIINPICAAKPRASARTLTPEDKRFIVYDGVVILRKLCAELAEWQLSRSWESKDIWRIVKFLATKSSLLSWTEWLRVIL